MLLLCCGGAARVAGARAQGVAKLITLDGYVDTFGARCLDGSPYELWHEPAAPGVNATRWVIDVQVCECAALAVCRAD